MLAALSKPQALYATCRAFRRQHAALKSLILHGAKCAGLEMYKRRRLAQSPRSVHTWISVLFVLRQSE